MNRVQILAQLQQSKLSESETIEFKSVWDDKNKGRGLSAFANQQRGGWLLVGVNDEGQICSQLGQLKKQKIRIEQQISFLLAPSSAVQAVSIEALNKNQHVLVVEVINPGSLVAWDGVCYKRVGANTKKMSPGEQKVLASQRPGLDFSGFECKPVVDTSLVLNFAQFLPNTNGHSTHLSADKVLSKLGIKNKNAADILFGQFVGRVVRYDENSDLQSQTELKGLYSLLRPDFMQEIQNWTRTGPMKLQKNSLSAKEEVPYPEAALREAIVNAVAHTAFEKLRYEVKVELYKNRIVISNYCAAGTNEFAKKIFSSEHHLHNPLLMKALRSAGFSDDLGLGRRKIFKSMIENGKRSPLFSYKDTSDEANCGTWSVVLYNENWNPYFLSLFEKLKSLYQPDADKARLMAAVILWRHEPLKKIFSYMDEYHQELTKEALFSPHSPFLVVRRIKSKGNASSYNLELVLKHWVKLHLEGQKAKAFSPEEERDIQALLYNYSRAYGRDEHISNKQARDLLGFSNLQSEVVRLARLLHKWEREGFLIKTQKRGLWRVNEKTHFPHLSIAKRADLQF